MFSRSLALTVKVCVLLVLIAAGALLSGPAGFGPEPRSAEAAFLSEVRKLLASDAQAGDRFSSVAVSGDTAVVGANLEDAGGLLAGAAAFSQAPPPTPSAQGQPRTAEPN